MDLNWYQSESADDAHDDQETDFASIGGGPGGAVWAHISQDGTPDCPWVWFVYAHWNWEDIDADPDALLAHGEAGSQGEAKAAVAAWADTAVAAVAPQNESENRRQ